MDGLEIVGHEHARVARHPLMVGGMSVVEDQVETAYALMGFVMAQADRSPRGSNIALQCWEIRNELEAFGADVGADPDFLRDQAGRPVTELVDEALAALESIPDADFPPGLGVVVPKIVAVQLRLDEIEGSEVGDHS